MCPCKKLMFLKTDLVKHEPITSVCTNPKCLIKFTPSKLLRQRAALAARALDDTYESLLGVTQQRLMRPAAFPIPQQTVETNAEMSNTT